MICFMSHKIVFISTNSADHDAALCSISSGSSTLFAKVLLFTFYNKYLKYRYYSEFREKNCFVFNM